MSGKHISIAEGGVGRQFTSDELSTPKVEGGTQLWVPKDEVRLTTKHISKNGTYPATSDGYYGFDKVTVNVPGGSGSSNNSGKPSGTDVTHTKPDGGLDLDGITPPGGPGSSVVGTDPETGNDVAVGVDEHGNIVKTTVPSYIEITKPPDDTEYNEGDTIIYDGVIVRLKKKDGTTFTDARYTNGHIPMQELIFPVKKAPEGQSDTGTSHYGDKDYVFAKSVKITQYYNGQLLRAGIATVSGDTYILRMDNTSSNPNSKNLFVVASNQGSFLTFHNVTTGEITKREINRHLSPIQGYPYDRDFYFLDRVVDWTGSSGYSLSLEPNLPLYNMGSYYLSLYEFLAGDVTFGEASIPVHWKSPYDGREMEDKFEITITGSSHSSESSSGNTGS